MPGKPFLIDRLGSQSNLAQCMLQPDRERTGLDHRILLRFAMSRSEKREIPRSSGGSDDADHKDIEAKALQGLLIPDLPQNSRAGKANLQKRVIGPCPGKQRHQTTLDLLGSEAVKTLADIAERQRPVLAAEQSVTLVNEARKRCRGRLLVNQPEAAIRREAARNRSRFPRSHRRLASPSLI